MNLKLNQGCFWGNNLKTCEVGEFVLSECVYPSESKLVKHSHDNAYFSILLQGGYVETYDRKIRECVSQSVVYHPEGELHADNFSRAGGRIFRMEIKPRWLSRVREQASNLSEPIDSRGGSLALLAMKLYKEFRQIDDFSPLVIEGIALEIVGEISRQRKHEQHSNSPAWLNRAGELLRDQFAENLKFTSIANSLNVHPVHFSRAFRKFYGCTLGEYVRRLRVESAARRLISSDEPLVSIAVACGFSDQSHFAKAFKNSTGMTPAQYRSVFRKS